MVARDEDALFCDLWQFYGVHDYKALPLTTAARLFCGLPPESRCGRLLSGALTDADTILLAQILDRVSWLCWAQTKDAQRGRNKPQSVVDKILGREPDKCKSFRTGADFERELRKLREEV